MRNLTWRSQSRENECVTDSIQAAPTGRAKCRGCGRSIPQGELRFGETGPSSYREGEATSWFHLACAALMRPDKLEPVLSAGEPSLPERPWLEATVREGLEHRRLPRLVRAERASSGRAQCRSCREPIARGEWRFVLQVFEDGRPSPIGTIHAQCAKAYFGTSELAPRLSRLSPELGETDRAELEVALGVQRPGLAKAEPSSEQEALPSAPSKLGA